MARLFPQDHGSATLSAGAQAELATLEALQAALPDTYTIFHGVHWADEGPRGTPIGELDFAVVNQADAILLIEQKAGALEETAAGLAKVYGPRTVTVADQVHRALNHVQAKYANTYPGKKPRLSTQSRNVPFWPKQKCPLADVESGFRRVARAPAYTACATGDPLAVYGPCGPVVRSWPG